MHVTRNWSDRFINKEVIGNTTFSSCAKVRGKPEDELGLSVHKSRSAGSKPDSYLWIVLRLISRPVLSFGTLDAELISNYPMSAY
jgi:hypothetical protein